MEPRIQYAKTSDGVNIAFWVMGEGKPLIYLPPLPQHAQLGWQMPHIRGFYEWLAEGRQLIGFDMRNSGLSQRGVEDVSQEDQRLDMDAVVARLGLDAFDLFAHGTSASLGIVYAVLHPEHVRRLILVDAYLPLPGVETSPAILALQQVLDYDWETFTEMLAGIVWGWASGEASRRYAELLRASTTPVDWKRRFAAATGGSRLDISPYLEQLSAPTLIVHHMQAIGTPPEMGQRLAAEIKNSRLVPLEGRGVAASYGDPRFVSAVNEFLAEEDGMTPKAAARHPGGFSTILFTDVEGSTALTDRHGDAKAREVMREHERITREALKAHGGSEVKTMGDGFMASFGSATRALECAIAVQRAFADSEVRVRIGLNAGEPIAEDDPGGRSDLFGTAVIVAARIAAQANGGEILVSDVLRQLVAGKDFLFNDRGEHALKGFEDPVRVWAVRWSDSPLAGEAGEGPGVRA